MAEALSLTWRVREIATCPVCMEDFQKPKSLPCVHSFCLRCLQGHFKDKLPGDDVLCPVCRDKFKIPEKGLDGLPNNFFVQNLIDARDLSSTKKVGEIPCEVCAEEENEDGRSIPPATEFCVDCNQKLCKPCSRPHRRWKDGPHNVRILGSAMSEDLIQQRGSFCEEHQKENVTHYCFDCKSNVCLMCTATSHKKHNFKDIGKVAEMFGNMIDADIKPILERIFSFQTAGDQTDKERKRFMESIQAVDSQVKKRGNVVKQVVVEHISHLGEELEVIKCKVMKDAETRKDELQFALTAMESFTAYSSELRAKGSPCDITRSANEIHSRAQELLQTYVIPADYNAPYVSFSAVNLEEFQKSKNNLVGRFQKCATVPARTEETHLQTDRERELEQQLDMLKQRHQQSERTLRELSAKYEREVNEQLRQREERRGSLEKQLVDSRQQAKQAKHAATMLKQSQQELEGKTKELYEREKELKGQVRQTEEDKLRLEKELMDSKQQAEHGKAKSEIELNQLQARLKEQAGKAVDMKRSYEDQLRALQEELEQTRQRFRQATDREQELQQSLATAQLKQDKAAMPKEVESKEVSRLQEQYHH